MCRRRSRVWRARVLEAPGERAGHRARDARARRGAGRHLRAARLRWRSPRPSTTRSRAWPGPRAGRATACALKLAAIRRARELGARRLVADTSPGNAAMLALNERLGYVPVLDVRNLEGAP